MLFTYLREHGVLVGDTRGKDGAFAFAWRIVHRPAATTNTNMSISSLLKCPDIKGCA